RRCSPPSACRTRSPRKSAGARDSPRGRGSHAACPEPLLCERSLTKSTFSRADEGRWRSTMSFNWFISVDDHLIEPARLWQDRVPAKWRDIAPRIVREGDSEHWVYEDRQIVTTGLNAVAGKTREEFSPEPITYEDMREGCYEPAARVADMDQGNVLASMLFPSFPRYCGQVFHEAKDKEVGLACVRAWNDFVLDELADAYPGRFIPMMIIPLWDPVAAATEIERTAARGAKSIAFSENPTKLGLPSIHTDFWDPVLQACNDTGFVISMHVGSSSNL